ncbi:MAG TPA: lysylphosphatidylglycerol synthase transmembrane domain-containing protein, partial [Planctomycetota bacterium]|nr:lysylphosphatidylglycerol synthase transmembrane domain-containing protein [Planctomycetota bacterium]
MSPHHRRLARRVLGLLVAALLVWVVYQTVPWKDRLLVTFEKDQTPAEWEGTLQGPWQAEEVEFVVESAPSHKPLAAPDLPIGTRVRATADRLGWEQGSAMVSVAEWRPGLPRVFRELQWTALLPALAFLLGCTLVVITRWYLLLIAAGCPTRWTQVLRVTFVGLFFNLILPGVSGGDLARAYWMVKGHPERRAAALMSVFMDRLLGLFAMALLATIAIYANDDRFAALRLPVLAATLAMLLGGLALVNPWLRTHLPIAKLLDRLPASEQFHALDAALRHYGTRPGAILVAIFLSILNHLGASG